MFAGSIVAESPQIGQLHCSRTAAAIVSRVRDERVLRDLAEHFELSISHFTPTAVRDGVRYPGAKAAWFQGHSGGADNGEKVEYNPQSHVLARCMHFDTQEAIDISLHAITPPRYVPHGAFEFSTQHGLRIGSTVEEIQRVYGAANPLHTVQGLAYAYERRIPLAGSNLQYVVQTIFFVRGERAIAIVRWAGV